MTLNKFQKIANKISAVNNVTPIQSGFNLYIDGKTYSFYYPKKGQNKIVHKTKVLNFADGLEIPTFNLLQDRLEKPSIILNQQIGRLTRQGQKPVEIINIEVGKPTNGVQSCINHIKAKIELIKADTTRDNNRVLTLLGEITNELKQYL